MGWLVWCGLHSLLVSTMFTRWLATFGGRAVALHRLFYVVFSSLTLLPLLHRQYSLAAVTLFGWHGYWRMLQVMLLGYGVSMILAGARSYDIAYFIGIRQWRQYRRGERPSGPVLHRNGVLAWVRHPWYSGGLALLWGAGPITDVTLVIHTLLSVYVLIGIRLEERKLELELGECYRHYRRQVPMLFPWKGLDGSR